MVVTSLVSERKMDMSRDGWRKPSVLFLDDALDVLMGFQVSLRKAPFHTLVTTNPTEVRGLLGSQPVDVLVCDERMPAVSGSELLESLQAEFPGVARILLTGHCDLPMAMRAMRQGRIRSTDRVPDGTGIRLVARRRE